MDKKIGRIVFRNREVLVLPGEVRVYARKSVASESAERSVEEQVEHAIVQADRMGLPLSEDDILRERPGRGGDEFWENGGSSDRELDGSKKRYRPELTRLVEDVRRGLVKVILCWDMTRLWRSVELCGALVDLLVRHSVLLVDRNGVVDIESPEGRQMVNFLASAAQHHREMCRAHSMRATQSKRERGEAAMGTRVLGFKSEKGKGIVHVDDEISLVRRIFRLYAFGSPDDQGGSGPLSTHQIASLLTEEGCLAFSALHPSRNKHGGKVYVYSGVIQRVLGNPRYIGKQRHKKNPKLYDARDFLIDGKPAVDPALWSLCQEKLARNAATPQRRIEAHPMSGWLRCGVCAKPYGLAQHYYTPRGGERYKTEFWYVRSSRSYHECQDYPQGIQMEDVDVYMKEHLGPVLHIELVEQQRIAVGSALINQIAELKLKRDAIEQKKRTELPKLLREHWERNPALVEQLCKILDDDLAELESEILRLELRARQLDVEIVAFANLASLPAAQYRDVLRTAIRWVAVVPSPVEAQAPRGVKDRKSRQGRGRLLILTAWGTYHTAVIEPDLSRGRSNTRYSVIRPAQPSELIGSVDDLPSPSRFFSNLRRERLSASPDPFRPEDWAPGYGAAPETEVIDMPWREAA